MPRRQPIRVLSRVPVWVASFLILVVLPASALLRATQLPTISMPDGTELRVLGATVGLVSNPFDPAWKRLLARFSPPRWQSRLGLRKQDRSTLNVWLGIFDPERRDFRRPDLASAFIRFADGQSAPAAILLADTNLIRLEFDIFPRSAPQLQIELKLNDGRKLAFNLGNPRQSTADENWFVSTLPITNIGSKTAIVLQESPVRGAARLALSAHSLGDDPMKWHDWSAELFDSSGNWRRLTVADRRFINGESLPMTGHCLKLVARPREFISAGLVQIPAPGSVRQLTPAPRATELGLSRIFLLGAGTFLFDTNASATRTSTNTAQPNLHWSNQSGSLCIVSDRPALLLLRHLDTVEISLSARLRERRPDRADGKIFQSFLTTRTVPNPAQRTVARIFPLNLNTDQPTLEAEIIANHPAAEFFISADFFR